MPVGHMELPQVIRPWEYPSPAKAKVGKLLGKARPCMYTKLRQLIIGHSDKELSIGLVSDAFGEAGSNPVAPIKMTETEASCLRKTWSKCESGETADTTDLKSVGYSI